MTKNPTARTTTTTPKPTTSTDTNVLCLKYKLINLQIPTAKMRHRIIRVIAFALLGLYTIVYIITVCLLVFLFIICANYRFLNNRLDFIDHRYCYYGKYLTYFLVRTHSLSHFSTNLGGRRSVNFLSTMSGPCYL